MLSARSNGQIKNTKKTMLLTRLTSSPYFYTILYIAVVSLLAFNLFEIVYLLIHKRNRERSEPKKEQLKRNISTAIITEDDPSGVLPKPLTTSDFEAYTEAASSVIESFEGEIAERAAQLVYKFGIDRHYKELFRSPLWFKRAYAIDMLSSLRLKKNLEFFPAVFKRETSDAVKYRLLYGLSLLPRGKDDIYSLTSQLSGLPYLTAKYNEDIFFNIITVLKNAGKEEEFGIFLRQIMTDSGIRVKVKRDCLSACHAAGYKQAGLIAMEYYRTLHDEPGIAIVCIKILALMKDYTVLPEALGHKDWRVRLTVLKYAHLCDSDIRQPLKAMLHDPNYHIRLNSALALSRLGNEGLEILQSEKNSPDKFAADVAKYALAGARTA